MTGIYLSTILLNIELVTELKELEKLRCTWNATLERSGNEKVYLTHEWFTSWWRAFGKNSNLFVLLVKHDNEVTGIAPLMIQKSTFRGFPVRSIAFISNDESPGCEFILRDGSREVIECIISFLLRNAKEWDIIYLKNILHNTVSSAIIEFIKESNRKYLINEGLKSPYLQIDTDWETYFGRLSTKSRKTIRNICNRVKRLENIKVEKYGTIDKFDDIGLVSKKGWKYKEGKAFINREDRRSFFELLSKAAQDNGWLSIWCMYKNNEPIAYEYHLTYKNDDIALLAEFNSDYGEYSPGANLDYEIIKSLFDNGVREYDMCGSMDEYKRKWTDDNRLHQNIIVFNNSIYPGLLYLWENSAIRLAKKSREIFSN